MLTNLVLWWSDLLCEVDLLQEKNALGRRRTEGGGHKVQSPNHKLNITDGFTDELFHWTFYRSFCQ
jgi:hypothetical protein